MSINNAIFDQTAFNYGIEDVIELKVIAYETINASLLASETSNLLAIASGFVLVEVEINNGFVLKPIEANEELYSEVSMYLLFEQLLSSYAEFQAEGELNYILSSNLESNNFLEIIADIGKDVNISAIESSNSFSVDKAEIHKIIRFNTDGNGVNGYSIIDFSGDFESVEEKTLYINVTIPPKGKLIIDANFFTAYLDGINVLDKVTGDWIDDLDRNTVDISVRCGNSSALQTSLLYQELYL